MRRRGSYLLMNWVSQVNRERENVSQQFQTMLGWQNGEDTNFDDFVAKKRLEERFEEMDQRVSRAFNQVVKAHKVEVINSFKRQLTGSGDKLDYDKMKEMQEAIEERTGWLRDVWHQIDADYRSGDSEREKRAATQISAALRGEPGDYMAWAYEKKRERRALGPKGQAEFDAEYDQANLPNISDDEANRYHNLQLNMNTLEDSVIGKYGTAGEKHWDMLQQEKDAEYSEKLDRAAETYKNLLKQQEAYDESEATVEERQRIKRVEEAKVRFKTAMDLEEERLRMVEAHEMMKKERYEEAKAQRREDLKRAVLMRNEGKDSAEVAHMLKMEKLSEVAQRQALRARREEISVMEKRRKFVQLVDELEEESQQRQGEMAMGLQGSFERAAEVEAITRDGPRARRGLVDGASAYSDIAEEVKQAQSLAKERGDESIAGSKKALWDVINEDKWEDPRRTIHQARLDARKTHDDIYRLTDPTRLRLGPGMATRGHGAFIQAHQEKHMLQNADDERLTFGWGPNDGDVHDLDSNGKHQYVQSRQVGVHRMDPRTGDIDYRFEKKGRGGAKWMGPRLYKMGEKDGDAPPVIPSPRKTPKRPDSVHPTFAR